MIYPSFPSQIEVIISTVLVMTAIAVIVILIYVTSTITAIVSSQIPH